MMNEMITGMDKINKAMKNHQETNLKEKLGWMSYEIYQKNE